MNSVTLGYLRMQAQDRADMTNNPSITTAMWNEYISKSSKELEDLEIAAYGNNYFAALPYQFVVSGNQFYSLPDGQTLKSIGSSTVAPAFYKLIGVDLQYSQSPLGWVSLERFEFIDRNKYSIPNNAVNYLGQTNLKYTLTGNQIQLIPIPVSNQVVQLWYIPEPLNLVWAPCVATTLGSNIVTATDITGLTVGMTIFALSSIPANTTITAINTTNNQLTLSNTCLSTLPILVVQCWSDATILQGTLSGWEEYVIVDAAIKAGVKSEAQLDALILQKNAMKERIEGMAEGRDAGQASHVSDVLSIKNGNQIGFDGGPGFSGDGYW